MFVVYQGKTQTVQEWSKELGVNIHTIVSRMSVGITDPELILSKRRLPKINTTNTYTYRGETKTAKEWAKICGYSESNMTWRLRTKPIDIALLPKEDKYDFLSDLDLSKATEKSIPQNHQLAVKRIRPIPESLRPTEIIQHDEPIDISNKPIDIDLNDKLALPDDIDQSIVASILSTIKPAEQVETVEPVEQPRRKRKCNPIRISPIVVEKMREYIGRKDPIYKNIRAIKDCIRGYFVRSVEVEKPRCDITIEYTSPTVKYYRHNNWILCAEGLQIKMIQYGNAKRWRVK
jgi:hypothetical protein